MVAQSFSQRRWLHWRLVWRIVTAAVALILLLQTGSRGAFAGLVIGLLALLVIHRMSVKLMVSGAIVIFSFEFLFKLILNADAIEHIDERWLVSNFRRRLSLQVESTAAEAYRLWLERPFFGGGWIHSNTTPA